MPKEILTQDEANRIFEYSPVTGVLRWKEPMSNAVHVNQEVRGISQGYLSVSRNNIRYKAHRVIWLMAYGKWPEHEIDHINGRRDDNRLCNLRVVSLRENLRNKKTYKNNKTGIVGVLWNKEKKKWEANIYHHSKKQIHLGTFDSLLDAACARKSAEIVFGYHPNHGRKS